MLVTTDHNLKQDILTFNYYLGNLKVRPTTDAISTRVQLVFVEKRFSGQNDVQINLPKIPTNCIVEIEVKIRIEDSQE